MRSAGLNLPLASLTSGLSIFFASEASSSGMAGSSSRKLESAIMCMCDEGEKLGIQKGLFYGNDVMLCVELKAGWTLDSIREAASILPALFFCPKTAFCPSSALAESVLCTTHQATFGMAINHRVS